MRLWRGPSTLPRDAAVLTGALVLATLLIVVFPGLRLRLVSLPDRIVLEVLIMTAMASAAMLLGVLRSSRGAVLIGRDAFIAALAVQVLANLAFGVLPAIIGDPPTFERTFYPWLVGRYIAGVLFLVAAVRVRPSRIRTTLALSLLMLLAILVLVQGASPQLPLPPSVAPGQIAGYGLHTVFEVGPLLLFVAGSFVAGRSALETGEPLERWLSLALLVGVFTQLHQALFPAALGEVITSADVLRGLAAVLLLIGAVTQVRRLTSQRDTALSMLQEDLEVNRRLVADLSRSLDREAGFASIVTHELSTPIAAINARVHVIATMVDETARPHVQAVGEEAERLGGLVRRMEELRDLEEGSFAVDLRPVAIAPLGQEVGRFARGLPGRRTVTVDVVDARVQADPVRLGQVLRNLVTNSVRHATTSSPIWITGHLDGESASSVDPEYILVVADEGPGVGAEDVESLFRAYGRGQSTDGVEGSGLGLHVAERIIAAHGGTISFIDPLERGARVQIRLKVAT